MSSLVNKIKTKWAERRRSHGQPPATPPKSASTSTPAPATEPTYSIQPHPATTNNPADLNQGSVQYPEVSPYASKGPYIPSPEIAGNLDKPATREELRARTAELNGEHAQ